MKETSEHVPNLLQTNNLVLNVFPIIIFSKVNAILTFTDVANMFLVTFAENVKMASFSLTTNAATNIACQEFLKTMRQQANNLNFQRNKKLKEESLRVMKRL
jgi:hypothetical protein